MKFKEYQTIGPHVILFHFSIHYFWLLKDTEFHEFSTKKKIYDLYMQNFSGMGKNALASKQISSETAWIWDQQKHQPFPTYSYCTS